MNEFIEQFLLESREYVEQATADLLALEKAPGDSAVLDSAFRAFHTLKGGAGIVDFDAMAEAVHAAEDKLSAVRSGTLAISAPLIGDCLTCLDQVVQWLDTIETSGELPVNAAAEAKAIVARFARAEPAAAAAAPEASAAATVQWVDALVSRHASLGRRAKVAIRYAPDPQCFFDGVDPCALVAALPGLLCLEIEPASAWLPLDELDPFSCNLVIAALTESARDEVTAVLREVLDQCDIRDVDVRGDREANDDGRGLPAPAREVLEAQIALIAATGTHGAAGRLGSAGAVAVAVLRHLGRDADAEHVARTTEQSLAAGDPRLLLDAIAAVLSARPAATPAAAAPAPAPSDHEVVARTLRIDASRIDALVNLTGELTVVKNSIGHAAALAQEQEGSAALASILKQRYAVLDRLVGELQRSVLAMRVLPLRHVFQRFPRLLREIAGDLGKPANLVVEGGDTEADKVIVEMLFEPLLHVLRNAIDHGIESAAARAARNKPPVADIRLRASRQSEQVIVEVADDGRGIDVARIRHVAAERAVLTDEALAALSDEEAINLIFEPGFSTASEVTGLSGRGVGMDAVRNAVERFGGAVSVASRDGAGTTVRFTLPFSVMMTRVMVVGAGGQTFGIPLDAVVETLRVGVDRLFPVGPAHAFVLRNRTIPVLALAATLGLPGAEHDESEATIVVTRTDGQYGALRVDRVGDRMEVMLKPLDGLLAGMHGIAGSTLQGDGSVLLVLDIGELFL